MKYSRSAAIKSNLILFEYFVVFVIVIYAGKATVFVRAIDTWEEPLGLLLPIITITVLGFIKGIRFNHKFIMLIIGFLLYFVASTVKFSSLHPRFFLIHILYFTIAYVVVSGLRYRFFTFYEDIVYYLCIIALIFWVIMNLMPGPFIELLRNFEFSNQGPIKGNVDFNTIVFTVNNYEIAPDHILNFGGTNIYRNAGFAWEPGAFATFINIAILFNLVRNKFKLKENKHLWVFIAALTTTFSTTGYSMFILLILFYIYNQDLLKVMWMAPIIVIVTVYLFSLPFMSEKITEHAEYNTEELLYYSAKYDIHYGPQRFQSLQIDFVDFLNHPLLGYGGHQEAKWTNQLGAQISTVSGIGKIMAGYGIVGLLFFLISLWQSSKQITILYNVKGTIFPVLFILLISISYSIITPLFMCIWLLYLSSFLKTEVIRRHTIYKILKEIQDPEPERRELKMF